MDNFITLNLGIFLYEAHYFIKKYQNYAPEISPEYSHILFISENLVIQENIFLHDILQKYNIKNIFIILEKNSHANLLFLQEDVAEKIESKNILNFILQESSRLDCFLCLIGKQDLEFNLNILLNGQNSQANVNGFYLANKSQKINMQITQKHLAKKTFSNLIINGVLADNSQVKYCGKIFVEKGAAQVVACQENKNILLGENITLDSAPQLEVLNSQAECKHGCAAGKFDENQLFYLQSRGLDKSQAILLLIESFFGFINKLDCDIKKREHLFGQIRDRLRGVL